MTLSVVVAGGGSAGHIEPALALADAVRRLRPDARITALGTERGLDTTLVPARGYALELIPPVPLPRKPSGDLLRLPLKVRGAVNRVREVLTAVDADVVVGFGGYVALPAYLGARGRVPIVVHEANARAGLANKVGARFAARVVAAVAGSGLDGAEVIGIPLRRAVTMLDRPALRARARATFRLPPQGPVLLVFGGSQGARTLNTAVAEALPGLLSRGIAVLHAHGKGGTPAGPPQLGYVPLPYIDDMHLAYAAADAVLGRAGAMTVAEVSAVGLPAVYVPLPHGNGEQALNAGPVVAAGGGVLVDDADLTGDRALAELLPILTDPRRLAAMGAAARASGHADADVRLAHVVLDVAGHGGGRAWTRPGPASPHTGGGGAR
ncbi:glycosyltransferase [Pseudonocardia sp.]|jgi:UDP-N-acetylglucosamine--N-acetylmuramyl-(pentapeptide) pyrophosphoryl-undecaprenol N-acetylglucosamine transferase|uniref:UDP-N-acetylglucosamine--N-acetylmuramyl- (pentapeptide) pyrophosphoryl-undecaprenol N-acetylglucosamine transferase n=1 Tax=Pseudonocardia sp. TaxID=60912 RepID=UPI00260DCDE7|nr:UDP-N-acetylglucosamine--N-acetylmuramyl-(pentapeptide) pyrophosphoryl-undecaprenol N-acetylglucosamine transferase [Pseudonocardia sp.]MCW2722052.1 UDP-N-acetylglucosamine--N-acetylmuramyl-(pentapeptide) pyrophosphoryl-undecaprenol [Pseudonocardia sp.]MDT7614979.1 UDP-N-acetylglucosamine--N-acetylmuramyl-(pentapeptide) pyrophosphoryl-undecaprenol [Pseudonocardiales bacterium]